MGFGNAKKRMEEKKAREARSAAAIAALPKKIRYFSVQDYKLIEKFQEMLNRYDQSIQDISDFIVKYAPTATMHGLKTLGNLQLRFQTFDWMFKDKKHIPDGAFKDYIFTEDGILATPDYKNKLGRKIRMEQNEVLQRATKYCYNYWLDEVGFNIYWDYHVEPGLIYTKDRKNFIYLTELDTELHIKGYKAPAGVKEVKKEDVVKLMQCIN